MQTDERMQVPHGLDILVIDDEESIREGCRQTLEAEGYRTAVAADGKEGLILLERERPRVVLLDLRMPGVSGVEVLERLPGVDPRIIPIIITGYGSIDTAVATMKLGAFDFLTKPFDMDQLLGVVQKTMHEAKTVTPAEPVVELPPPPAASETDVLLKGLDVLGQAYALGMPEGQLGSRLRELEAEARHLSESLGEVREKEKVVAELVADLRLVDRIIEKHEFKRNALIQILLDIQAEKRWIPRHAIYWISRRLQIPTARLYEIATFYEAFSLVPQGRHTIQVCTGTACHVRNAPELAATISALLGIKPGETDQRLLFTLKTVNCLGCCALAPVMKIDETYYSNPSLRQLKAIFKSYEKVEEKGEKPCRD